ncbi:metallophosphoesterase family protein [Halalkalibacter akibai]|uniref:Phosphoesterase n=1 Tax=Halalkalibacter akibai (strain ATCC 43226 / DSM 21942 / CIP 109018 / JCM 9157 / 1139) TaxID=1236973 RepID=W4QUA5_HALA3|nr:metallophosphoesterase [Halalkalibacter akibai]GAE35198.1 putative phosphoesterase [Halalkalibacter akibai JCM 9157]
MKIIVLSDTHIPTKAKKLPERLLFELPTADLIIHAGDWQTKAVYKELSLYAEVKGVYGNVDGDEIKELFSDKIIVQCNQWKIGVIHGHGTKQTTEKRAISAFLEDNVDCIIYGHSHIPVLKKVDNILLFNPGSATDKRRQKCYSFGILTVNQTIEAEHVFYEDKL